MGSTSCFGSFAVLWLHQAVDTFSSGKLGEPSLLQAGSTSETNLGQEPHCTGHYLSTVHRNLRTIYSSLTSTVAKTSKFETCMCILFPFKVGGIKSHFWAHQLIRNSPSSNKQWQRNIPVYLKSELEVVLCRADWQFLPQECTCKSEKSTSRWESTRKQ